VEERLRLFQQICEAVQFAHSNLIVHRDLKPGNILVTGPGTEPAGTASGGTDQSGFSGSGGPQVKLLDFGIAKALEGADGIGGHTQTGEGSPMTPSYAAPEQVEGASITTATDVYAMGLVLCELLTGHLPYDVRGRSPVESAQAITEAEPKRLSQLVDENPDSAVVEACGRSAEALRERLAGDLDVIVQKALRKDPDRRYTSAPNFGQDVDRHLEGLPVEARPATTGYRLRRFVSRNRTAVMSAAGAVVALLIGLGAAIWQAQVAAAERDRAQQSANRAEAVRTFLVDMIERAAPATTGGEALTMREVLDEADTELESRTLQNQPEVSVEIRKTASKMYRHMEKADAAVEQGRKAYVTGTNTLGPSDPQTVKAAATFGRALRYDSQLERADSLYNTVLSRLEDGAAGPGTRASLLSGYGKLLQDLSRTDSAETVLLRALDLHDQTAEPDTIELVRTLGHLGHTHLYQGRFEDGEERYRRALSLVEQVPGDRNLLLKKDLLNDLAILYANSGKPERSEEMYRRALKISKRLYGDGSADVAMILNNLSDVLEASGKLKEADRLSARSLALHRKHYSSSHQWVGYTLATRVEVLRELGEYEAAISRAKEALDIFETSLGPNHPHALVSHGELAGMYLHTGALTKAGRHAEEALSGFQAHHDDSTHADIVTMKSRLGAIRTKQGRYEDAEELLLEARSVQGVDSSTVAATRERLSTLYETWPRSER
jgi:serine/threonine-protein kinase